MAALTFPNTISYELVRDSVTLEQRYADAEVTEMEDGPAQQLPRQTASWSTIPVQMIMTGEDYAIFDSFVVNDLFKGTARFYFPIGRFDQPNPPLKLVQIQGGKFSGKPHAIGYVAVSFVLKVLNW